MLHKLGNSEITKVPNPKIFGVTSYTFFDSEKHFEKKIVLYHIYQKSSNFVKIGLDKVNPIESSFHNFWIAAVLQSRL